jgi:hypothetical protein
MKKILIQLDTDPQPSSFDSVVAVDAGVEELLRYGSVTPETVEPLVHGAMFTRGPADLKNTAIFVGGSIVADGEQVFDRVCKTFFGPVQVSVMIDSNGSNTTAAAAVLAAKRHLDLSEIEALVLGGTGPVGQRAAQLLAMQGAKVRIGSRSQKRAAETCNAISEVVENAPLTPYATSDASELLAACDGVALIIAAGAAGVTFLTADQRGSLSGLKVAIDLNAVPPVGLAGIEVTEKATDREGVICYGAIGVGGTKMKIHKAAIDKLFESNDQVLDTEAIFKIGESLGS